MPRLEVSKQFGDLDGIAAAGWTWPAADMILLRDAATMTLSSIFVAWNSLRLRHFAVRLR